VHAILMHSASVGSLGRLLVAASSPLLAAAL
jgi:hypothetical protein